MSTKPNFPCSVCLREVNENVNSIYCDFCHHWVHRKCNELSLPDFRLLANSSDSWMCLKCNHELFPFSENKDINSKSSSKSKSSQDLIKNRTNFSSTFPCEASDCELSYNLNCKYYDIPECKYLLMDDDGLSRRFRRMMLAFYEARCRSLTSNLHC